MMVVTEWPRYRVLTTQSDVWTFRFPMWEIVTMGKSWTGEQL